jgi:hypothetical protein
MHIENIILNFLKPLTLLGARQKWKERIFMQNGHCGFVVAHQGRIQYGLNATKFVQSFLKYKMEELQTNHQKSRLQIWLGHFCCVKAARHP